MPRLMMSWPWAASACARASTVKADSVPSRDRLSAKCRCDIGVSGMCEAGARCGSGLGGVLGSLSLFDDLGLDHVFVGFVLTLVLDRADDQRQHFEPGGRGHRRIRRCAPAERVECAAILAGGDPFGMDMLALVADPLRTARRAERA